MGINELYIFKARGEKLGLYTNDKALVPKRIIERNGLTPRLHLDLVSVRGTSHGVGR